MKIFTLEKYDNFILSKFKSTKVRYFFLKLPIKVTVIAILALIVIINYKL